MCMYILYITVGRNEVRRNKAEWNKLMNRKKERKKESKKKKNYF